MSMGTIDNASIVGVVFAPSQGRCPMQIPYPPPPGPIDIPGPVEQVFSFCVVFLLLLSMVLLVLPRKWLRRVIQVAFHLRGDSRIDGEVR